MKCSIDIAQQKIETMMTNRAKTMNAGDWALLWLLSLLWGLTFVFVEIAIDELPPMTIVLARVAIGALLLLPLLWWRGLQLPNRLSDWTPFLVMGLLNNVIPFSLINTGQLQLTAGLTSILNATTPLFTVLVMAAAREEALSWNRLVGVCLGIAGVAVLSGGSDAGMAVPIAGMLFCLGGALSYGFAALWARRNLSTTPPLKSATCQLISSAFLMSFLVVLLDQPWRLPMPGQDTWIALLGMAALSTALAYLVFYQIVVRAGAGNVMLVTLLIPITAIAVGSIVLGETIGSRHLAGALVIGLGLLFIDGRIFGVLKSQNS